MGSNHRSSTRLGRSPQISHLSPVSTLIKTSPLSCQLFTLRQLFVCLLIVPFFSATMASPNNMPRIVELADQISSSVSKLQERLTAQGVPSPSWNEDSPQSLPADVNDLKDAVLDASAELHEILLEPLMLIFKHAAVRHPGAQMDHLGANAPRSPISSALTQSADTTSRI